MKLGKSAVETFPIIKTFNLSRLTFWSPVLHTVFVPENYLSQFRERLLLEMFNVCATKRTLQQRFELKSSLTYFCRWYSLMVFQLTFSRPSKIHR